MHRVVVVGGGFAGVRTVRRLATVPGVDITLIDRTNHFLFQPMLYQVATGVLSGGQISPALRSIFRRHPNVRVLLSEVDGFDLERRVVKAFGEHEYELPYDTLVVAAGATHSYFGRDDWAILAPGMKTVDDAHRLRSMILGAFELAEAAETEAEREAWMTFAIVGAGPTGVEMAGQVAELGQRILASEYRSVDTSTARIVLLDSNPRVLKTFPEKLSARAKADLEFLGIDVRLGVRAVGIDPEGLDVKIAGEPARITAKTVIWAAGVKASPLGAALGVETDRAGRVIVGPDLTVPGHPELFALGDMAAVEGVPGVAQGAIQGGEYAASVIAARLRGTPPPAPFRYKDKGSMATIGRRRAVVDLGHGRQLTGGAAYFAWGVIHLAYLSRWEDRIEAVWRWAFTVLGGSRRERLISIVSLVPETTARSVILELRRRRTERLDRAGQ
jgi:NADH dehydrogenase